MAKIEEWQGFVVPVRDNNNVRHRRIEQGERAMTHLSKFQESKQVVVQAGANWGYWPLRMASMFDVVYTFEPDPVCFSCLCANTSRLENVIRIQAALGYERNLIDLHRSKDTTGNQHIDGPGVLPTLRIDDLNLKICDLIYLDVEGQESEAIKGAKETIKRCLPVVIYEERNSFSVTADEAKRLLETHGYKKTSAIGADNVMTWQG